MTMRFKRFGKTYQLQIETARDLEHVLTLDEALWVATSVPVDAIRCDRKLLDMINLDGSGRINTRELQTAIRWLIDVADDLTFPDDPEAPFALSAIRADTPEGKRLVKSAGDVLEALGDGSAQEVSLPQVRAFLDQQRERPLNGDGIVVAEAAHDDATRQLIADVLACTGSAQDASGKPGVDESQLDAFMAAVHGLLEWREAGRGVHVDSLVPFGADTPQIYARFSAIASEVDAFFHACELVRFENGAASRFEGGPPPDVDAMDQAGMDDWLRTRPLAKVNAEGRLALRRDQVNPYYADKIECLRNDVIPRILDESPDDMGEASWSAVKAALKPYGDYIRSKQGANVESLPPERLEAYQDGTLAGKVRDLIAEDRRIADVRTGVIALERLLLYRGYLLRIANNFVSFSELYDATKRALFETGSAVIDGRWFNLAFKVHDIAEHQKMAKVSNIFTLYLEISEVGGAPSYTVAVPAMSGSKGNLDVGKRGVFFDTDGNQRSARVTHVIANPISMREALCAPFVKLWGFLIGKIESMSASSEKALLKEADGALALPAGGQPAPTAGPVKGTMGSAGMLVGLSVSAAAIGSAFAFITKTFASLRPGQILLGIAGAALVVMLPVSLIAILKLRRQDLSALLEGCGWAINARMRPTRRQRRQFTVKPRFPEAAAGVPRQSRLLLTVLAVLLVVLLWRVVVQIIGG